MTTSRTRFVGEIPSGDPVQNRALAQDLMNEFPLQSLMTNLITGDQGELVKQFQTREELEDYQIISIETQGIGFFAGDSSPHPERSQATIRGGRCRCRCFRKRTG